MTGVAWRTMRAPMSTAERGIVLAAALALLSSVLATPFRAVLAADEVSADEVSGDPVRTRLDGTGIAVLLPADWHVGVGQAKLMPSLVAREPARGDGAAEGALFTINVISNLAKTRFRLVSEQLARYADDLAALGGVELLAREPLRRGDLVGESLLLRHRGTVAGDALIERRVYLADDRRDWLVVASFRAAGARWERLTEQRRTMIDSLALD